MTQPTQSPTSFAELNETLLSLVHRSKNILLDNFFGAYLVGSFAVGDADLNSDCDFLIVINKQLNELEEKNLRELHRELPTRDGFWSKHLEGSYAVKSDLDDLSRLQSKWLFIDHGHREMEWSTHCNSLEHRWSLRERGIVIAGPDPKHFTAPIPKSVMKEKMKSSLDTLISDMQGWITVEDHCWAQRYIVTTICRILYSIDTGGIASKRASLLWAQQALDSSWFGFLQQVIDGRELGFNPDEKPAPAVVAASYEFILYTNRFAQTISQ